MSAKITPKLVMLHLDLKGLAFRSSYLPRLLDDLAEQKINSLLVEYEDVFPFSGMPIASDPSVVWPLTQIKKFAAMAQQRGIEIVPLFQCLGHLEYLLAWKKYRKLAEDEKYPSTLKLRDPSALKLIGQMLREMLAAHPASRFIHLGMDEAHGLKNASKRLNTTPLSLYMEHLDKLLPIVEAAGLTPMIWSDMLEDHYEPLDWQRWRKRVVLCTWDYSSTRPQTPWIRWQGNHVSRAWLDDPASPEAPTIGDSQTFIENQPKTTRKLIKPYMTGRTVRTLFQIDLWTKLGFRVMTTSAARVSAQGAVLPDFNKLMSNVKMHSQAIARNNQLGQIASSWARGTSWCPPNFPFELCWPMVHEMSRSMRLRPAPLWPGVDPKEIDWILSATARTRHDWRLEKTILKKMEKLAPSIKKHLFEWQSLMLMIQTLAAHRRAEYAQLEVDYFNANNRPVDSEWQRRLADQQSCIDELQKLKARVRKHSSKRYHGLALDEWIAELFDLHLCRLVQCKAISKRKKILATKRYQ